ncbi:hypothetical protein M404DRAFT_335841 [Pisolithus tinctorius Marx 270]|uniref:Uncharacterized protein n=1 Tax=Pisolithus tinctorius Marx 270 TaxID=870435 RepID=A0A0C3ID08_PISTI|nr:hypothetical protein M404DRAFT_335841 [Pisolithus tinctorius Marx 270]
MSSPIALLHYEPTYIYHFNLRASTKVKGKVRRKGLALGPLPHFAQAPIAPSAFDASLQLPVLSYITVPR